LDSELRHHQKIAVNVIFLVFGTYFRCKITHFRLSFKLFVTFLLKKQSKRPFFDQITPRYAPEKRLQKM